MTLLDRFLRYVSFDTQSDPASKTYPSTKGQLALLQLLADEMRQMGVADVAMNEHGYVTGTIPPTAGCESEPTIGFFAHVDTSPDAPGKNIKPQLIDLEGDTIIRSDGTTLLGADNKAGVAEIMTAAEHLLAHPELPHGRIRIAFTPDEEIGLGVEHFDTQGFGADFAYTVDGGGLGELEYENFNAASANVSIRGRSIHPGNAKGMMVNALRVAIELDAMLPQDQRPETTEGYEGFFHITRLDGTVERATVEYIIRDHDRAKFEQRKSLLINAVENINRLYKNSSKITISDTYYNMREILEKHPEVVERAKNAMLSVGVEPVVKPIRGGTDGARLSFMGLPCPNIFTGGGNFHSRDEFASLAAMTKAVEVIIAISTLTSAGSDGWSL